MLQRRASKYLKIELKGFPSPDRAEREVEYLTSPSKSVIHAELLIGKM
jgi:hypothetical protein